MPVGDQLLNKKYKAFISYSHANNREQGRKWADWLHQQLETYEIPAELVGKPNDAGEPIPHSIFPVFQDEKELSASSDLAHSLTSALEQAEFLIFLASPKSAQSRYVRDELKYFKQLGRKDKMIALILSGEPEYGDSPTEQQCFPAELRFGIGSDGSLLEDERQEVLAADVRLPNSQEEGYTSLEAYKLALQHAGASKAEIQQKTELYKERLELAKLKIIAGVLGVPLGELTKRDKAFQLEKAKRKNRTIKRVATAIGMLAIAAAVAGVLAWMQKNEAQKNLSLSLYNSGINKLTESEYGDGAAFIAAATRGGDQSAALFGQSMLAMQENLTRLPNVQLTDTRFSPDGKWLVGYANSGLGEFKLQLWDTQQKKMLKQFDDSISKKPTTPLFDQQGQAYVRADDNRIMRVDVGKQTMQALWQPADGGLSTLRAVSPDGKWLAVSVRAADDLGKRTFQLVDTATGAAHELGATDQPSVLETITFAPDSQSVLWSLLDEQTNHIQVRRLDANLTSVLNTSDTTSVVKPIWHPNSQALLFDNSHNISVYQLATGQHWQQDKPASGWQFANFNPQGNTVLLGSYKKLQWFDGSTGRFIKDMDAPYLTGFGLMSKVLNAPADDNPAVSPDMDQELVNLNKQPFLRDMWSKPLLKSEQVLGDNLKLLRPAGDGEHVYVNNKGDNTIQKNSVDLQSANAEFIRLSEPIVDVKVLAKAKRLVVRGASNTLYVFDEATGQKVGKPIVLSPQAKSFQVNTDETRLLGKTAENRLAIWDISTGEVVQNYQHPSNIARYITDDSFQYVLVANDADYAVYGLQDAQVRMQGKSALSGAKFSPNGRYLELTQQNGKAEVVDTQSFKSLFEIQSIANPFVVFNHQGTVMAISEDANYMRLWDVAKQKPFGQRIKVSQKASVFDFTADDARIFVQSDDAKFNFETKIIDAATGIPMTMPFANASYIESYVLGDKNLLTVENKLNGYVYKVWEIPGLLNVDANSIADDLERYYGKTLDLQTGAIDNEPPSTGDYATWYFQDAYTRSLTPGSNISVVGAIKRYTAFKSPADVYMLSETFAYHPLARAALAKHFSERPETSFVAARYLAMTQLQVAQIKDGKLKADVEALLAAAKQQLQVQGS